MAAVTPADYGGWDSPIDARAVAEAALKFSDLKCDPATGRLYWLESRPAEAGRNVILSLNAANEVEELLPQPWSARSAVHEYGGGAFTVYADEIWFVNAADQAIYHRSRQGLIKRITHPGQQFADLQYDAPRRRLIAVCETPVDGSEARASVVSINSHGECTPLATGRDFYASPRLSPAGDQLVWLCWDHPNMPWDGCELWARDLEKNSAAGEPYQLAGGNNESLFQPQFAPSGELFIISDRSEGWWNIHQITPGGLTQITHEQAEFGLPQWVFGQSTYCFDDTGQMHALFTQDGLWQLAQVDRACGALTVYDLPFTHLEQLHMAQGKLAFLGGSATQAMTLCTLACDGSELLQHRCASDSLWDETRLSTPDPITYSSGDNEPAHALFYPPVNPDFTAPSSQRPPLIIKCHGGPTGATTTALDPRIQFWTSRGFAVLDVNYRGSTGYGRSYRQKLTGNWGIADVQDCEYGARYLVAQGLVDADKLFITGSSAGGYTVLCVLCFANFAAAGTSYYGIADLARLLASTHKFESRYLGKLIGDDPALLRERSPLHHAERVDCPVLFLQGLKDKVVPPDQATAMVQVLRERGVPVTYISFAEERHGFKSADNLVTALEAELKFYRGILGNPSSE